MQEQQYNECEQDNVRDNEIMRCISATVVAVETQYVL
jgi:hypothetical protein